MTLKLTASPEVIQTCREVVQTLTTDVNQAYISGLTEGLKIGVFFLIVVLAIQFSFSLSTDFKTRKSKKLQQSNEVQS